MKGCESDVDYKLYPIGGQTRLNIFIVRKAKREKSDWAETGAECSRWNWTHILIANVDIKKIRFCIAVRRSHYQDKIVLRKPTGLGNPLIVYSPRLPSLSTGCPINQASATTFRRIIYTIPGTFCKRCLFYSIQLLAVSLTVVCRIQMNEYKIFLEWSPNLSVLFMNDCSFSRN